MDFAEGTTIEDVVKKLGIEKDLAKIILVNHSHQPLEYELKDKDQLSIFPPVGGG